MCERYGTPESYLNWDNQDHRAVILGGPDRSGSPRASASIGCERTTRSAPSTS